MKIRLFSVRTAARRIPHPLSCITDATCWFLLPEEPAADVRPEFFHDIENATERDLLRPLIGRVTQGAVDCRVVEIGDTGGHRIAGKLGRIKVIAAVVAPSDDRATDGVCSTPPEPSRSFGEIARILTE